MPITLDGTNGLTLPDGSKGEPISGTAVASTSGTSIDFTGIPSWAKRVTVIFSGVSTSGTSNLLVQVGSGSFTTTGYLGAGTNITSAVAVAGANYTAGFGLFSGSAANIAYGAMRLHLLTGNTWVADGTFALSNGGAVLVSGGSIALSGTLDRVRITTANGTDTFDAGTINIMYE